MAPRGAPPDLSDLYDFFEAFHAENDRAAAILGGALLDELLKRLLRASFLEDAAPDLLTERGALGAFGVKIDMAYALGWLTKPMRDDLKIVQGIRNEFAHALDYSLTFEDDSISARTGNLTLPLAVLANIRDQVGDVSEEGIAGVTARLQRDLRERGRQRFATAVALLAERVSHAIDASVRAEQAEEPWDELFAHGSYAVK